MSTPDPANVTSNSRKGTCKIHFFSAKTKICFDLNTSSGSSQEATMVEKSQAGAAADFGWALTWIKGQSSAPAGSGPV